MGRSTISVLNSPVITVAVGSVLGFLAGLGVGGGSLLMLWLTVIIGVSIESARCINLLFFIPCAVIASVFRWRQGSLQFKKILPAIISGCISSGIFSVIHNYTQTDILQTLFGMLLIFAGIRELFYRPRKAK